MTAPAPGRTADNARCGEDDVRETIARFLWHFRYSTLPDATWDDALQIVKYIPDGKAAETVESFRAQASLLLSGPLAQLRSDLAAARKERDEARARLLEAEKGGEAMRGDPGGAAYEARFAHARPRDVEPWDSLTPEVKAIWARVEAAAGAVMRARCMEVIQAVYDGWDRNNPEEEWPRVALSQAMVQIRQILPRLDKQGGDSAA